MPRLPSKQLEKTWWVIWTPGQAGPSVVQAVTPGQAVEHFLATHGMLRYDEIKMCKLDGPPENLTEVCLTIPIIEAAALDKHHHPTILQEIP